MSGLTDTLRKLLRREPAPRCDGCAFVEFFRSNGDGQVTRIHAYCRCPDGLYQDRPVPVSRYCERWERRATPAPRPKVGDPSLTA